MSAKAGFDWYGDLPAGVECLMRCYSESRRSASYFIHRLDRETATIKDQSNDPVISLSINPNGVVDRAVEGQWERAELLQASLTLTPAFLRCDWRWTGDPLDIFDVYLPYELMQAAWAEHFKGDPARVNLQAKLVFEDPSILLLMQSILATILSPRPISAFLMETITNHLISSLLCSDNGAIVVRPAARSVLSSPVLQRVKDYVEAHIAEDISLDMLAREAGVSRFHFIRLFKDSVGMTPHAYLIERRMVRACNLLMHTKQSIGEISVNCGFEDPSYFAARFRRLYRMCPREFRKRL